MSLGVCLVRAVLIHLLLRSFETLAINQQNPAGFSMTYHLAGRNPCVVSMVQTIDLSLVAAEVDQIRKLCKDGLIWGKK